MQEESQASPHLPCTLKPVLSCKLVRLVLCVPAQLDQEMVRGDTLCGLRREQQRGQQRHPSRCRPVSGRPAHRVRLASVRPSACLVGGGEGGWGVGGKDQYTGCSSRGKRVKRRRRMRECGGGGRGWVGVEFKASPRSQIVSLVEVGFRRGEAAHAGWFEFFGDVVWSQSCILSFLSLLLRLLLCSHP